MTGVFNAARWYHRMTSKPTAPTLRVAAVSHSKTISRLNSLNSVGLVAE